MPSNFGDDQLRKLIKGNETSVLAAIEQELYALGEDIRADVVAYLEQENINVDGDILKSISYEVDREIGSMSVKISSNSDHAVFVHEGTKPHWPPVDPIRRWAIKKLGVSKKEVGKATWFIRKKIASKGTTGKPFLTAPFYLYQNVIGKRVSERIIKTVGRNAN